MAVAQSQTRSQGVNTQARPRGPISRFLDLVAAAIVGVVFAVAVSVVVDMVQVATRWTALGEGPRAMRQDIATELQIVTEESANVGLIGAPVDTMLAAHQQIYEWWEKKIDVLEILRLLGVPTQGRVMDYLSVALLSFQQTALRLVELYFALPLVLMFALLGIVDGLVKRDLRRRGGARESSSRYDLIKRLIPLSITLAIVTYTAWTTVVDPAYVMVPGAMALGVLLRLMTASYKKYF